MNDETGNNPNAGHAESRAEPEAGAPAPIAAPAALESAGAPAAGFTAESQAEKGGSAGPMRPAQASSVGFPLPSFASVPSAPPVPWRGRDLALFLVFTVFWLLLSQFLSLAGYAALRPVMGWQTPVSALDENALFAIVVQLIFYGPLLLFIFLMVGVYYRQPFWEGIRWRWPGGRGALRLVFGGIVLAVGLALASSLTPESKSFPLEKLFSSPVAAYALSAFAVTVAPFMEELIFRAVLFSFFERGLGLTFAVAGTALLFAAMHVPEYWGAWTHVAMILVVGIVFSLARGITGSLAPSVILHAAYNATLMTGLYLGTHHFHNLHALLAAW
ncbi:MAG TPA: CPBP family intramembrane glutamic endopeptidase [Terriglobia bacterium]|nr:CPBP family intramembrane glutamic endopeptidase [Terriglobia bacterium]